MMGVTHALCTKRDLGGILAANTLRSLKKPQPAVGVGASLVTSKQAALFGDEPMAVENVTAPNAVEATVVPVNEPAKARKPRKSRRSVNPDQLGFDAILAAPEQVAPPKAKRTRAKRAVSDDQFAFGFVLEEEVSLPGITEAASAEDEVQIAAVMDVVMAMGAEEAAAQVDTAAAVSEPVAAADAPVAEVEDDGSLVEVVDPRGYLSAEQERALALRWIEQGDIRARDRLVVSHRPLCHKIAHGLRGYTGRGIELEDLTAQGQVGLIVASERFKPSFGVRFGAYASWWVRAAMTDYILANWSPVRMGNTDVQKKLFFCYRRTKAEIERAEVGLTADEIDARIAQITKASVEQVRLAAGRLNAPVASLNVQMQDGEGDEWMSMLADDAPSPEEVCEKADTANALVRILGDAMEDLTERERDIVRARYLVEERATLEELSVKYGVARERIRQIAERALLKTRKAIEESMPDAGAVLRHLLAA